MKEKKISKNSIVSFVACDGQRNKFILKLFSPNTENT